MKNPALLRNALTLLLAGMLLSCGGGGGGGSGGAAVATSNVGTAAVAGTGTSASVNSDSAGGAATGASTSASTSTAADGSTATASSGDGSGVGSGGTGISTGDASTSVGSVSGLGSIIVDSVRYNIDSASVDLHDAAALDIGMTVSVRGPINASAATGVAQQVSSSVELRGPASAINSSAGSFVMMGTVVTIDEATVMADLSGLADLPSGSVIQVWGLPAGPGLLRATRIQRQVFDTSSVVTGTIERLDAGAGTFSLGGVSVAYGAAAFGSGLNANALANGAIVRARSPGPVVSGVFNATQIELWYPVPVATGTAIQLEGVITNYASLGSFNLLGSSVDASMAQVTGGQASKVGNGVTVEVAGTLSNGVLVASKVKIKHLPGGGALPSFTLIGPVGNYVSPASFRVHGQQVDASGASVVFVNGMPAMLSNGTPVTILGSQIVNGALIASQVTFN